MVRRARGDQDAGTRGLLAPRLAGPRAPLTPPPALRQVSTNKDAVIKMLLQSVTTVDVSK